MKAPNETLKTMLQNSAEFTHYGVLENSGETPKLLDYIRKKGGYTIFEIVSLSDTPLATLNKWIAGDTCPSEKKRLKLIEIFTSPDLPPSKRTAKMMGQHHLTWDSTKRRWKMRVTIDTGSKTVGMRQAAHLPPCDLSTAIMVREMTLSCLRQFGLTVKPRIQKRRSKPLQNEPNP